MNRTISEEDDANFPPVAETMVIGDGNQSFYMKDVPARMIQISEKVLKAQPMGSNMTDSYHPGSIKSAERKRRGCGDKYIVQGELTKHPQDWPAFRTNGENKEQLIHLLAQTWSSETCAEEIHSRPLIFIEDGKASFFSSDGKTTTVTRVPEIDSSQAATDNRIILYLKYC